MTYRAIRKILLLLALTQCAIIVSAQSSDAADAAAACAQDHLSAWSKTSDWIHKSFEFISVSTLAPLTTPIDLYKLSREALAKEGIQGLKRVPIRFLNKRAVPLTVYVTLIILANGNRITISELEDETRDFETCSPDALIVYVNALPKDDPEYKLSRTIFASRYANFKDAHYIESDSWADLDTQLKQISQQTGKKIARLDIHGHGWPGTMYIRDDSYDQPAQPMPDIFATNAKIRFTSCLVANGTDGYVFMQDIGNRYLQRGGAVYASSVVVKPSFVDYPWQMFHGPRPPRSLEKAELFVLRPFLGAKGVFENWKDSLEGIWVSGRVRRYYIPPSEFKAKARTPESQEP